MVNESRGTFEQQHYLVLQKLLCWRGNDLFPVLDLLRCLVLSASAIKFLEAHSVGNLILRLLWEERNSRLNQVTILRVIANLATNIHGRSVLRGMLDQLLVLLQRLPIVDILALSALLYNLSVYRKEVLNTTRRTITLCYLQHMIHCIRDPSRLPVAAIRALAAVMLLNT